MQLFTMTGMSVSISCCWLSESPPLPAAAWMAAHQLAKANFFSPSMYRVLFTREKREANIPCVKGEPYYALSEIAFPIFKWELSGSTNAGIIR